MRCILIVDDDRAMVRTLSDIFRLRGWDVLRAHSGEEAVALQQENRCPVVLMDIRMPGMDGIAAAQAMRAITPVSLILLMTAETSSGALADAERKHDLQVIPKPVDIGGLFQLLG